MEKKNSVMKPKKKGIWAIIKESLNKSSSGCGPGCGCHISQQDSKNQRKESLANS